MCGAPAALWGLSLEGRVCHGPGRMEAVGARAVFAIVSMALVDELSAAENHVPSHVAADSDWDATPEAISATRPMPTPPIPDTCVNDADFSMVSRMYRRLSMARS